MIPAALHPFCVRAESDRGGRMGNFQNVFGAGKPVIAMVHLGALPGTPLYDGAGGIAALVAGARADLRTLQAAGFDAVMFGNENDRPYEFRVDPANR